MTEWWTKRSRVTLRNRYENIRDHFVSTESIIWKPVKCNLLLLALLETLPFASKITLPTSVASLDIQLKSFRSLTPSLIIKSPGTFPLLVLHSPFHLSQVFEWAPYTHSLWKTYLQTIMYSAENGFTVYCMALYTGYYYYYYYKYYLTTRSALQRSTVGILNTDGWLQPSPPSMISYV